MTIIMPDRFMRFSVRNFMFFRSPSERQHLCKKSDRLAYYYLGTTGDAGKDARIARFDRAYSRGLGIAAMMAVLGMILFAILHAMLR